MREIVATLAGVPGGRGAGSLASVPPDREEFPLAAGGYGAALALAAFSPLAAVALLALRLPTSVPMRGRPDEARLVAAGLLLAALLFSAAILNRRVALTARIVVDDAGVALVASGRTRWRVAWGGSSAPSSFAPPCGRGTGTRPFF